MRRIICPDKVTTAQWLRVHDAAHGVGLRSNVTLMFGHADSPRSWARHLLRAREQQERSGGFTEFVPLPFVPMEAPMYVKGLARRGPTFRETLLVHAVGRLALHPWITNIQASWVKLGPDGTRQALGAGVNDLGGTLMNESISRSAGAEYGQELPPERDGGADPFGRPRAATADDALRRATRRARACVVRRAAAGRAAQRARQGSRSRRSAAPGSARAPRQRSTGMNHLALAVSDQDRSRSFYETYLGFSAEPAPRADGVLILHDAAGFSLALGETDEPIRVPEFLHFGVRLLGPDEVRSFGDRLAADGVEIVEVWDEPDYVSVKFRDPDRLRRRGLLGAEVVVSRSSRSSTVSRRRITRASPSRTRTAAGRGVAL